MKLRTDYFIDQLSTEFGLSKVQIKAIIDEPFKFITKSIRENEGKSIRLHNLGIFFLKKKFIKYDELNGNSEGIEEQNQSESGNSRTSTEEI